MSCKSCIKIKSHLKLNEAPEYYIEYEVNSSDNSEIKNGIDKIKQIHNEIIEEAVKNGEIKKAGGQEKETRLSLVMVN